MSSPVNSIAFRLGRTGSLLWGKQSFLFFNVNKTVRLHYLLIKFLIFVLQQERFFIVDFLFNYSNSSKFFLLLLLYKAAKVKKRYELKKLKVHKYFIRLNRIIRFKIKNRKVKKRFIKKKKIDHRFLIHGRYFYFEFEEINHKKIKQVLLEKQLKSLFPVFNFFKKKLVNKKNKKYLFLKNYFKFQNKTKKMYKSIFCFKKNNKNIIKKKNYLGKLFLPILLSRKILRHLKIKNLYYTNLKKYINIIPYWKEVYINFGRKTTKVIYTYNWNKTLKDFFYKNVIFIKKKKKNTQKKINFFLSRRRFMFKKFSLKNTNKKFSFISSLLNSTFLMYYFNFKKDIISINLKKYLNILYFLNLLYFNKKTSQSKFLNISRNFFGRKKRLLFFEFFLQKIIKIPVYLKINKVNEVLSETRNFFIDQDVRYIYKRCFIPRKAFIFCKNFIHLLTYSIIFFNLIGLSTYFIFEFYYRKRQKFFLLTVEKILRFMFFRVLYFSGFCLLILGKLARRKPRARNIFFFKKKIPQLSAIKLKVQYVYKQCISMFGAYGVKMWLYHY